jgi:MFS transporter, FSR family, fosmidomycin resistance protein
MNVEAVVVVESVVEPPRGGYATSAPADRPTCVRERAGSYCRAVVSPVAVALPSRVVLTGPPLALLIAGAHLTNDAFTNILPVYLPTLQVRFGLGEALLATLVAIISISANVLQAFMGALTDRWGRRRMAALGLFVGSVLMSFIAVAPTFWALVLILAIGGLGSAIFHPGAVGMMRDVGARKSLFIGVFAAAGALGSAIMPVVVLWIMRTHGPQYVPWLAVIGIVVSIVLFVFAPTQVTRSGAQAPKVFDPKLFAGPVGLLSLAGIMRATAFVSFSNAMPLFLVNVRGFAPDAPVIGLTLAAYGVASAAGGMLVGVVERRVGRIRLIVATMLLAVPMAIATLLVEPATPLYYVVVAAAGALANASVPLLVVSAQDLAPHAVGSASGMLMGFTWGTAGVAYIGFGALQEAIGIAPALTLSFVFLVPAAALAGSVLARHRDALS